MTAERKTYSVGNIKQLIDLNKDSTNFDITFSVQSKDRSPFYLLVADQTTLDNNPNLEYKYAKDGVMSGNIIQDKNVYQNFFLVLKADKPCDCDVEIVKKDLPRTMPPVPQESVKPAQKINWVKVIFVVIVIAGGAFLLYWFLKKDPHADIPKIVGAQEPVLRSPVSSRVPSMSRSSSLSQNNSPVQSQGEPQGSTLAERLKRLNLS